MSASVCSPAAMAFAPGVFMTMMPRLVAHSTSIPLRFAPIRPITRSLGAFSNSGASTGTSSRAISAWADFRPSRTCCTVGVTMFTLMPLSFSNDRLFSVRSVATRISNSLTDASIAAKTGLRRDARLKQAGHVVQAFVDVGRNAVEKLGMRVPWIGNGDCRHARGYGGSSSGRAILQRQTVFGGDAEAAGRFEVNIGRGLAVLDVVAADANVEDVLPALAFDHRFDNHTRRA